MLRHALTHLAPAHALVPTPVRARATRALVLIAFVGGLAAVGSVPATPARAGATDRAPADVAALTALVTRTAADLTDGTRRLEQSQAHLAEVQSRQTSVRAAADVAAARAQTARSRLGEIVGAQYRTPQPGLAVLVLSGGTDTLNDTVQGLVSLEHVRGDQQATLDEADAQGRAAQRLVAAADGLAGEVARERDGLAALVAELGRRAQEAGDQLDQAATALKAAEDQRTAAAGRASRDRTPAAGPPTPVAVVSGTCGGGNLSGYPNGMLPASALCPLAGTNGLVLRADAAAAFNRMAAAGGMPCAGNSYRSYAEQVALYKQKPGLAAVPGTSNHGWGIAVDFACGAERYGSPAYQWLKANGPRFGWSHPAWAEPGGNRPEPWHWEFTG